MTKKKGLVGFLCSMLFQVSVFVLVKSPKKVSFDFEYFVLGILKGPCTLR